MLPRPRRGKQVEKEFLYVGHYIDTDGNYILKIGTTNDLRRRATEHTRHYRKAKNIVYPQPQILSMTFPCGCLNTIPCDMRTETAEHGKKAAWVSLCGMTALIAATASLAQ